MLLALCMLATAPATAQQLCKYDSVPATTPASRFTDNGDGTVTDRGTGLQWKRCGEGQSWSGSTCTGNLTTHTWQAALQLAEAASYAGHADWRLPDVKEMESIVEIACYAPAVNLTTFPATPASLYWTSSPYADRGTYAWSVNFINGKNFPNQRINNYYVRLLRGGR